MRLKQWMGKRRIRIGVCLILIAAILLNVCWPGIGLETVQPDNPIESEQISEITPLQMGENTSSIEIEEQMTETEETESEEMESEETESEETETESESDETESEETETETESDETESEETESETQETQENNQGTEKTEPETDTIPEKETQGNGDTTDGSDEEKPGTSGDETAQIDVAMLMTWYQYGTQPELLACAPSEVTNLDLNTARLENNELKYEFAPAGTQSDQIQDYTVFLKEGDGAYTEISKSGAVTIRLPGAGEKRNYTFRVDATLKADETQENPKEQEITFTYSVNCYYAMDIELELEWKTKDGSSETMCCKADDTVTETVTQKDLTENVFSYTPRLTGALADGAQIINAEYRTASGATGSLNAEGGSLIMQTPETADEEIYYLTFEVQVEDETGSSRSVFYHFNIHFSDQVDVQLSFTWLEKGMIRRNMICQMNQSVSADIKNNQLSAGAVKYEIVLEGEDSENARILNLTYTSDATGGGKIDESGALSVSLPDGYTSNTYVITALVLVNGIQTEFEIVLNYSMDVYLEMQYNVQENGSTVSRSVTCENGKSKTAEVIYDDQLSDNALPYAMALVGQDASDLEITSVSCYQSGNNKTVTLNKEDTLSMALKNGKTGEHAFTVLAKDGSGTEYKFQINVPYKHRGENAIKITTNLTDGQVVTNEANMNLRVNAWTEDENGTVTGTIPANGTDTKLIVKLDGEEISYTSTSGSASEYTLYPKNPETGDNNTHTVYIYAEDAFGNFGELNLTLNGERNQKGQKIGTATIYIDMSVLGLGVVGSVSYEVLADEPISYAIAKAVLGQDTGEPFGAADNSLAWGGRYSGTLDSGFYLQSLSPGYSGNALTGGSWGQYGSNEEEILNSIDKQFGKGTGLATLWRCIYRNGLNKSSGSGGSVGEFDYTSGSGWLYSLDGTYYPGQSMSELNLQNGDVLTLRYTLAYGWDVGGGTSGYGNTVGYCVSAINGGFSINHRMQKTENKDGTITYSCKCCGLTEDCEHQHKIWKDLEDGTHIEYCEDCKDTIGDPVEHIWEQEELEHKCSKCEVTEEHIWEEVEDSNTATCTEPGVKTMVCRICEMEKEEESPELGHTLNSRWNHTAQEHYQKCSVCGEIIEESKGLHQYRYHAGDNDWYCEICDAGHDWDYCGNDKLAVQTATCQKVIYVCSVCGVELMKEGTFAEYHKYEGGKCTYCGADDPNAETDPPQTDAPETDPPQTDAPETEPPQTDPPQTDPPQTDPPQTDPPQTDPPQTDPPQTDPPQTDPPQTDPPQTDPPQTDPPQTDPPQTDPPQTDPPQTDPPQTDPPQTDSPQEQSVPEETLPEG